MNIIVCIAVTPDTTTKIRFVDSDTKLDSSGVQFIINPLDEFALTRALELKEADGSGMVTVINVGSIDAEPVIRKALAIGADEAIRVDAEPADCYFVATQIANALKDKQYDAIFTGRETIDFEGGQVGGMVAEFLNLPFINGVPKLDMTGTESTMEREIDGGKEVLSVNGVYVAAIQEGVTMPRIPSMRGIMSSRTKPLNVVPPTDAQPLTSVKNFELPPVRTECKLIDPDNAEELINLLHTEAKVI